MAKQAEMTKGSFGLLFVGLFSVALLGTACSSPAALATLTPSPTPTAISSPPPTAGPKQTPTPTPVPAGWVVVSFGNVRFAAEVADTPAAQQQGLSGRASMPLDQGMWFDFHREVSTAFWMHEMLFPLDMVWLDQDLHVVHVTHNAPAPAPGTPDADLPLYSAGVPIRYVLEINAGLADRYGIAPGSVATVTSSPQPPS